MKIVILDGHAANPGDLSWKPLEKLGEVVVYERTLPEQLTDRAKDADAVLTNKVYLGENELQQLPKLKYIGVLATGYNAVDIKAACRHGVTVTNIPAYSTDSVAQHVFALILNVLNRVDRYADDNRNGRWSANPDFCYWDMRIRELASMKMGIIGLGNIGRKVAKIALAFGAEVYAFTSKEQSELPEGIRKCSLDELYGTCDIISLHCPLTDNTKEIINSRTLAMMQPGTILVNTGRGPLVNEHDVANALQEGRIAAYATDVMCQEPPEADNPLFKCQNAFITPHMAWGTVEARQRLMDIALNNIIAFAEGKPVNVVKE